MANEIQQFFRDHGISEVEAIIPDMAGIARGADDADARFAGREMRFGPRCRDEQVFAKGETFRDAACELSLKR